MKGGETAVLLAMIDLAVIMFEMQRLGMISEISQYWFERSIIGVLKFLVSLVFCMNEVCR